MPWSPKNAPSHTKQADTPHLREVWAAAANSALEEYDGDEGKAIRVANAAVNREKKKGAGQSIEDKSNKLIRDLQNLTDRF